jgi:hypothetical protein
MFSDELINHLKDKKIVDADLVASSSLGMPSERHGFSGEHLYLELETGFRIYLPYRNTIIMPPGSDADWPSPPNAED